MPLLDLSVNTNRVKFVRIIICLAILMLVGMSISLWLPIRNYPVIPVLEIFQIPFLFSYIFFGGFLLGVLGTISGRLQKISLPLLIVSYVLLVLLDINRLQPFYYMLVFMVLVICWGIFSKKEGTDTAVINALRLIVIGTYLWSGLHKFNPSFVNGFYTMISGNETSDSTWRYATLVVPLAEAGIAIGLIISRFRRIAITLAVFMHLSISWVLSPFENGWNLIVIPWNIAMIALVIALFYKSDNVPFTRLFSFKPVIKTIVIITFFLLPLLNLFGRYDNYLSANLYSFKTPYGKIYITDGQMSQMPEALQPYLYKDEKGDYVEILYWCMNELGVTPYPEERVFKKVKEYICEVAVAEHPCKAELVIY